MQEGDNVNVEQIRLDLPRTFPSHKLFKEGSGKDQMLNILKAYSIFNPQVGYCQGMSFVCASLLINQLTEEESFWMLVGIMDLYQDNYATTMTGILANDEHFRDLMSISHPAVYNHMEKLQTITVIFVSRWFLTLFTDIKHWQTVLRLWDIIFFEGKTSLLRIALAIVNCCDKQILQCQQFDELGSFLINIPKEILQPKFLLPALFAIDLDDLIKKSELKKANHSNKSKKDPITSSTLLSQMSQFWNEFNKTPQKFVSNKPPQSARSVFSFSLGFLTNKLGYLSISQAEESNHTINTTTVQENNITTPDKKRLGVSSIGNENPLKKSRSGMSMRITSFFSK